MAIQTHIKAQFTEICVMQMNISAPFPLEQLIRITAYDDNGTDLTRYLNILSNRINFNVPGTYVAPVFLQANNQVINQVDIVVHVLSPNEALNVLPIITKDTNDVFVQETNIPNPYRIADFINIQSTDIRGQDITENLILNMSQVDYTHAGDYVVIIKAPDHKGNIAISTFHLHVLTEEQVDQMEQSNQQDDNHNLPEPVTSNRDLIQAHSNYPASATSNSSINNNFLPNSKNSLSNPPRHESKSKDKNDENASYWVLIKKYWPLYIILAIVYFTCWDMFG